MDQFQEILGTIKDNTRRITALESYNQVEKLSTSSGTTILDGTGLVSTANFASSQLTDGTQHTTTSTSFVDVPGATMSNIVLTRTTRIFAGFWAFGYNANYTTDGSGVQVRMFLDASNNADAFLKGTWYLVTINFGASSWTTTISDAELYLGMIFTLNAGTYAPKLSFKVNGTGTATLDFYNFFYIILGS